jgi:hypothetical protein
MSKTLNRRTALALVASLPATTVPAAALGNIRPDAELIALGKQFDALDRQYTDARRRQDPIDKAFRRLIHTHRPNQPSTLSDERAFYQGLWDQAEAECGGPVKPHPDDISEQIGPLTTTIIDIPASTIEGLAVKARVARHACWHFYETSDEDADWDHQMARGLIDAVLKAAARNA